MKKHTLLILSQYLVLSIIHVGKKTSKNSLHTDTYDYVKTPAAI